MHPYLETPAPVALAHRGGAKEATENTIAAFARAVRLGFTHLETDVQLSADGEVVVLHDTRLRRIAGVERRVGDVTWAELSELRIAGEPIPRLSEVFESFPGSRFSIDAKTDDVAGPLVDLVARFGMFDRVCFGAFSDRRLTRIRRSSGGAACTTVGPAAIGRLRLASFGIGRGEVEGDVLAAPSSLFGRRLVDRRFLAAAHARGLPVHVWTVDDPEHMRRLLDLGTDGIFTDRPLVLREVMSERGLWQTRAG